MRRKPPPLAKLNRPKLHGMLQRGRLFQRLEETRTKRRALCVVGPPGAGKTTLVATWLEAESIPSLWFQVDNGDTDLATFFFYLTQAAEPHRRKKQTPLPLLTPEYLPDVPNFSRRYFRELFTRLPKGSALVLDNYQEVAADAPFHGLIAQAIEEIPAGITLVVISRRDPPDCYARLIANQNVGFIDWDELKLTPEEARAIGVQQTGKSDFDFEHLYAQSGGWAAGLTLLLERLRRGRPIETLQRSEELQDVFNYFADQILADADEDNRAILLRLALVPRITAKLARQLTGNAAAPALLDYFYRRRLFTDRRIEMEPVYQFHALFRAFLKHRASQVLLPEQSQSIVHQAAAHFEAEGHLGDTFELYREIGALDQIAEMIHRHGATMLETGRWQTLIEWTQALPEAYFWADAWLQFWRGAALSIPDQPRGLAELDRAEQRFAELGDTRGRLVSAHAAMTSIMANSSAHLAVPRWAAVFQHCLDKAEELFDSATALRLICAGMQAWQLSFAEPKLRRPYIDRLRAALFSGRAQGDVAVLIGSVLAHQCWAEADNVSLTAIRKQIETITANVRVNPAILFSWLTQQGMACLVHCQVSKARAAFLEAKLLAEQFGWRDGHDWSFGFLAAAAAVSRDFQEAERLLEEMGKRSIGTGRTEELFYWHWRFVVACIRGDLATALSLREVAERTTREIFFAYMELILAVHLSAVLAAAEEFDEAKSYLKKAQQKSQSIEAVHFDAEMLLTNAFIALREGHRDQAFAGLRRMLDEAENPGKRGHVGIVAPLLVDLFAEALRDDVETDRVRRMIEEFGLRPPMPDLAHWPWPVRVRTLGKFAIEVADKALTFEGKAPRKPLALLMSLICEGGQNVPAERLMDALWPDGESDAVAKSFRMALVRLRDLLGASDRVRVTNGMVNLDLNVVWVDALAFERLAARSIASNDEAAAEQALALYEGPLLPAATDAAWAVSARERLRSRFLGLIATQASKLETSGRWQEAAALYQRGIAADELGEQLYRGWIRCLVNQGLKADATSVLQRLRRLLAARLNTSPAPETLALLA